MPTSHRIAGAFLAATTMLLIAPHLAQAQDADAQEVMRYTLTEAGLAKYSQATKQLAALPEQVAHELGEAAPLGRRRVHQSSTGRYGKSPR